MLDLRAAAEEFIFWTVLFAVALAGGVLWLAWKFVAAVIRSRRL